MKKAIVTVFVLLIIGIGAVSYYMFSNLDEMIKAAIEKYGSQTTQTSVRVDQVKFTIQEGSGAIYGLRIANPSGFSNTNAFSLGEISTKINIESLTKEVYIIDDVSILTPQIIFEMNEARKTNLNELKNNINASIPGSGNAAPTSETSPQSETSANKTPKLIIRRLKFAEGIIQARVVPLNNKEYQLKLPALEMKDLGGKNGATPSEISNLILNALIERAREVVKQQGFGKEIEALKMKARQKIDAKKIELNEKADAKKIELKEQADAKIDGKKELAKEKLKGLLGR